MKRALLLASLIALIVFSGCAQPDITPSAKQLPQIAAIFEEYPNAEMEALYMKKDAVLVMLKEIRVDCGRDMQIASYWYVTVRFDSVTAEFYLDETAQTVLCAIVPEKPLRDECSNATECDDADPTTRDECKGKPKKCVNTPITTCGNDDGFCPSGCVYENDNDCPSVDQCQSDFDCIDSNRFTKDVCSGTPKTCHYSLKSCEELNESLCETFEVCTGSLLPTTDRGACCDIPCIKTETCEGVTCPPEQKCVRGNCIDKSCAERELPLCTRDEKCTEDYYRDDFGITCCTDECRKPCDSDANCSLGEVCRDKY